VSAVWWHSDWLYYRTITIDNTKIDNPLENFPILVNISDAIGDRCMTNGEDIRFLLPDNVTELNYEIERWVDNGDRLVWVNVTSIANTTDTVFLMYYGNTSAADGQNVEDTWNSNYILVAHMNDSTVATISDSTSNDNNGNKAGANNPIEATGIIGRGQQFDGTNDNINCGSKASLDDLTERTCSMWCYPTQTLDIFMDKFNYVWYWGILDPIQFYVEIGYGGVSATTTSAVGTPSLNTWQLFSYTYSESGDRKAYVYLNGTDVSNTQVASVGAITPDNLGNLVMGDSSGASFYHGYMDEVQISNIARNDSWLKVDFHTQNQTEDFLTWSSEYSLYIYDSIMEKEGFGMGMIIFFAFSISIVFVAIFRRKNDK